MEQATIHPHVPYSQEAEEAVIGAVLSHHDSFIELVSFLRPEDFFILRHQHIWSAMCRIHERREQIDYVTALNELRAMDKLEIIGGPAYLTQLVNNTPASSHAITYGRLVERAAVRRRLLSAADRIKLLAVDEELTAPEAITEAERELLSISCEQKSLQDIPFRAHISAYFDKLDRLMQHPGEMLGIPTGFKEIDHLLQGLQKTDLIIFAGRPGLGKTSWLVNVVLHAARLKQRIGFITLEMGVEQIVQRMVSVETAINLHRLRNGSIDTASEWPRFVSASGRMSDYQIFLDDTAALTPLHVRQRVQRWIHQHGLDLLVVDYLQKMSGGPGFKANDRVHEVSYIARSLKDIAKDFRIPVLAAAQLSRAVEQRQDRRPVLADLRDSGEIEQEADVVMFLYRDEVYNEDTEFPNQAEIIIAKHRNGPLGTVNLYFDKAHTAFHNPVDRRIDLSAILEGPADER